MTYRGSAREMLAEFAAANKSHVVSQVLSSRRRFERKRAPNLSDATVDRMALEAFETLWSDDLARLNCIPGKDAISAINARLQEQFAIAVTPTAIIDEMRTDEVPNEMKSLIEMLAEFSKSSPRQTA
jgi:hypothetical protein